jgi:type II secretory pathway pseudopilin PulG
MRSSPRRECAAFSLLEVVIAICVAAILAAGLAIPLAAQLQARRADESRRQLDEARDALFGFAAAHGRLPCPASAASRGEEAFAAGGDAGNGRCADFHAGLLPAAALGLAPLDDAGFLRDPWQATANRVRYAVHGGTVNGVTHPLTRVNGMQSATLQGLAAAPHFLFVCATGEGADASGCGPAANQLTRRAAFVLLSLGPNAAAVGAAGPDETRNLDGDASFVSHEASASGFDDVVHWASIHALIHRLVSAGRLP